MSGVHRLVGLRTGCQHDHDRGFDSEGWHHSVACPRLSVTDLVLSVLPLVSIVYELNCIVMTVCGCERVFVSM